MIFKKWFRKRLEKQQPEPEQELKVFVIDTNMLLNGKADYLARLSEGRRDIMTVIPWAVIDELSGFRRRSFAKKSGFNSDFKNNVRSAWSVVSDQIDAQKWRTIGSGGKTFKEIFQRNGFALGVNDVRILSAVGNLKQKFKAVFLVTRDRRLCETAVELGIQTIDSLTEFSKIAGTGK